jgi:hypothetical protein
MRKQIYLRIGKKNAENPPKDDKDKKIRIKGQRQKIRTKKTKTKDR